MSRYFLNASAGVWTILLSTRKRAKWALVITVSGLPSISASIEIGIPAFCRFETISILRSSRLFIIILAALLNEVFLWFIKSPTICMSLSLYATDSSVPGINFNGAFCSFTALMASSMPDTVSWSVSANAASPFCTALPTSTEGGHVPSE